MKIKTYIVSSLAEAIERIKRDLGPEAVILSTKKTVISDKWWNRDSGLEVTAAIDLPVKPMDASAPVTATGQTMKLVAQMTEKLAEKQISPLKEELSKLRESLDQMVKNSNDNLLKTTNDQALKEAQEVAVKVSQEIIQKETLRNETLHKEAFKEEAILPPQALAAAPAKAPALIKNAVAIPTFTKEMLSTPLVPEINAVTIEQPWAKPKAIDFKKAMIGHGLECLSQEWLDEVHRQRQHIYKVSLDLLGHRIRPQTVQDVTNFLLETNPDGNQIQLRELAAEWLMEHLPSCRPFMSDPTRQNLVALLGPTGSGKTTTLVKLASHLILEQKQSVAFISLDHQRIGGKEQLKRHASILKAPCLYARTPLQFQKALSSLEHFNVVLIDTAGCSPNDDKSVWDLHQTLACDKPVWKALVLPATLQEPDMTRTIRKFSTALCQQLIVTKLDETSCFGTLYNAPTTSSLTPAYFTMGQQIPEDFEVATKERIVDCLLNFSDFASTQVFDNTFDTESHFERRELQ